MRRALSIVRSVMGLVVVAAVCGAPLLGAAAQCYGTNLTQDAVGTHAPGSHHVLDARAGATAAASEAASAGESRPIRTAAPERPTCGPMSVLSMLKDGAVIRSSRVLEGGETLRAPPSQHEKALVSIHPNAPWSGVAVSSLRPDPSSDSSSAQAPLGSQRSVVLRL